MFYIGFEQDQLTNEYKIHAVADTKQELFGYMDNLTFLSFCGLPTTGSSFRKLWLAGFNESRNYETPIFPPLPNLSIGPLSTSPVTDFDYRPCECTEYGVPGVPVYGAELVSYNGTDTVVVLPRITPTGLPIIKIADNFTVNSSRVESVTFSGNIVVVGNSAFKDCTSLKKITFTSALKEIKASAFKGCTALTKVCFIGNDDERNEVIVDANAGDIGSLILDKNSWELTPVEEVLEDMSVVVNETATFPVSTVAASISAAATVELLNQAFKDNAYAAEHKDQVDSVLRNLVAHMNQADWHAVFVNYGINPKRTYQCDACRKEVLLTTAGHTVHGTYLCEHCFEKYMRSKDVLLEFFVGILNGTYDLAIFADHDLFAIEAKVQAEPEDFFTTHCGENKEGCLARFEELTSKRSQYAKPR